MLSSLWQQLKERYQGVDSQYSNETQQVLLLAQQELNSITESETALNKALLQFRSGIEAFKTQKSVIEQEKEKNCKLLQEFDEDRPRTEEQLAADAKVKHYLSVSLYEDIPFTLREINRSMESLQQQIESLEKKLAAYQERKKELQDIIAACTSNSPSTLEMQSIEP